jgi:chromosome segregation ATPase
MVIFLVAVICIMAVIAVAGWWKAKAIYDLHMQLNRRFGEMGSERDTLALKLHSAENALKTAKKARDEMEKQYQEMGKKLVQTQHAYERMSDERDDRILMIDRQDDAIAALNDENMKLKDEISVLQAENERLQMAVEQLTAKEEEVKQQYDENVRNAAVLTDMMEIFNYRGTR